MPENSVYDDAQYAFWDVVAKHYPNAVSGDVDPLIQVLFDATIKEVIDHWIDNNVPSTELTPCQVKEDI